MSQSGFVRPETLRK